jgi:hypothetical protein
VNQYIEVWEIGAAGPSACVVGQHLNIWPTSIADLKSPPASSIRPRFRPSDKDCATNAGDWFTWWGSGEIFQAQLDAWRPVQPLDSSLGRSFTTEREDTVNGPYHENRHEFWIDESWQLVHDESAGESFRTDDEAPFGKAEVRLWSTPNPTWILAEYENYGQKGGSSIQYEDLFYWVRLPKPLPALSKPHLHVTGTASDPEPWLNLRAGPGTDAKVIGQLPDDTWLFLVDKAGNALIETVPGAGATWIRVRVVGGPHHMALGWVHSKYTALMH